MEDNHLKAKELLRMLYNFLVLHNEGNFIRGVHSALGELETDPTPEGYEKARSLYRTMVMGGRGLSEYIIWVDNKDERIALNNELENLREKLWELFGD